MSSNAITPRQLRFEAKIQNVVQPQTDYLYSNTEIVTEETS